MKKCTKCGRSDVEFYKNTLGRDGLRADCKLCVSQYDKQRYVGEVRERKIASRKKRHRTHPDVYNLEYHRKYEKNRYSTNVLFRLRKLLRSRHRQVMVQQQKKGSAVRDLGCTVEELYCYLESKFLPAGMYSGVERPAMTWKNQGRYGWHIDHIEPLIAFNLTIREQYLRAYHYSNLQPLWSKCNLKKGGR